MQETKKPFVSKWNVLFDKPSQLWISFQPKLGLEVYPCYSCRDIFGSRNSFLDHVNRRGILLKYACRNCSLELMFYNPCSFLLHMRQHYGPLSGRIDLDSLDISSIPIGMAGFLPHPKVPTLFDVRDDEVGAHININTRFYSPLPDCKGEKIVTLIPTELLFFYTSNGNTISMVLRQVSSNIPRCKFVQLDSSVTNPTHRTTSQNSTTGLANGPSFDIANDINITVVKSESTDDEESNRRDISDSATKQECDSESSRESIDDDDDRASSVRNATPDDNERNYDEEDDDVENYRPTQRRLYANCPECATKQTTSMKDHFLQTNKPSFTLLRCDDCSFVGTSKCSLQAHKRLHDRVPPFVCPECGKDHDTWDKLGAHMEDVCFHTVKQARYRCPGKKCGKLFMLAVKFADHLRHNINSDLMCPSCSNLSSNEHEFLHHYATVHDALKLGGPIKVLRCLICNDSQTYPMNSDFTEHMEEHSIDRNFCTYIYNCKSCRGFYRSSLTYATHLLKCKGSSRLGDKVFKVAKTCKNCNYKTSFDESVRSDMPKFCHRCAAPFVEAAAVANCETETEPLPADAGDENISCILCKKSMPVEELKTHFSAKHSVDKVHVNPKDGWPKSDDGGKKKRKRSAVGGAVKSKRLSSHSSDVSLDNAPEAPTLFDGLYRCKLCSYSNDKRVAFHAHVQEHRDVSTAYQCMECGECFVVKPSLVKHLLFFHQITDTDDYLNSNECFDKKALKELEENMKSVTGEIKEPVDENQCRVCRLKFPDAQALSKHFRVHGMAYLMKNRNC